MGYIQLVAFLLAAESVPPNRLPCTDLACAVPEVGFLFGDGGTSCRRLALLHGIVADRALGYGDCLDAHLDGWIWFRKGGSIAWLIRERWSSVNEQGGRK